MQSVRKKKLKAGNEQVHNEFQQKESGEMQCRHCSYVSTNKHTGKLENHLIHNHAEIYANVLKEKQKYQNLPIVEPKDWLTIQMNEDTLKRACTQLVVLSGRPLVCVEDPGFRMIIDPILQALPKKITVSRHTIKDWIRMDALALREKIREEIRDLYFSIKLDLATRQGRSIFGVNLQFIKNGRFEIRTIGMKETFVAHTSENLLTELEMILKEYDIDMKRLYRVTGDNGSNIVKMGQLISEKSANSTNTIPDPDDDESDLDSLADSNEIETFSDDEDDESLLEFNEDDTTDETTEQSEDDDLVDLQWQTRNNFKFTGLLRCFEHSLQLAPTEMIKKNKSISNLISIANNASKKLRTPLLLNVVKLRKLKKPQRRNDTRWSSTFLMLSRLRELRSICKEFEKSGKQLKLSDLYWSKIDDLLEVFGPLNELTLLYQKSQLTLSEAYANWRRLEYKLKALKNQFSSQVLVYLEKHSMKVLKDESVLAAVFLDLRFSKLLTAEEKDIAMKHIIEVHQYITRNKKDDTHTQKPAENEFASMSEDPLEVALRNLDHSQPLGVATSELSNGLNITEILNRFQNSPRVSLDSNFNVLMYWNNIEGIFAELKEAALTIFTAAATQVSVERAFSALKYILSDLRGNTDPELLEDILILYLNNKFEKN